MQDCRTSGRNYAFGRKLRRSDCCGRGCRRNSGRIAMRKRHAPNTIVNNKSTLQQEENALFFEFFLFFVVTVGIPGKPGIPGAPGGPMLPRLCYFVDFRSLPYCRSIDYVNFDTSLLFVVGLFTMLMLPVNRRSTRRCKWHTLQQFASPPRSNT